MAFACHPIQMNGENMLWGKCCEKNTEMNKISNILFGIYVATGKNEKEYS